VGEQFTLEMIAGRFDKWPELKSSLATIEEVRVKDRFGQVRPLKNPIDPKDLPENQDFLEHSFSHLTLDVLEAKRINRRAMQREYGLTEDDDAIVVAWTSRLDQPQKGVEDFIALIPTALELDPRVQIVVIGDAPRDQQKYEQQIRALMQSHRKRLYYQTFDQRRGDRLYAQADLVVGASRREPFGLFLTQSIAAGAIVTAPANGGTLDIVKPLDLEAGTGNGVIYNDPDVEGLRWGLTTAIAALVLARSNPERWNAHVKRMMGDIRVEFGLDRYMEALIAAYNRVAIERGLYEDGYVLL
jgi:glycogen synthase